MNYRGGTNIGRLGIIDIGGSLFKEKEGRAVNPTWDDTAARQGSRD